MPSVILTKVSSDDRTAIPWRRHVFPNACRNVATLSLLVHVGSSEKVERRCFQLRHNRNVNSTYCNQSDSDIN